MSKPIKTENDKDHRVYLPMGGGAYIVGAWAGDNPARGEIGLLFPAFISIDNTGTRVVIDQFKYVQAGDVFTLRATALLGEMAMPQLMRATYDKYLEEMRALVVKDGN